MKSQKLKDLLNKITQGELRIVTNYTGLGVEKIIEGGNQIEICVLRGYNYTGDTEEKTDQEFAANAELISLAPQLAKRVIELGELLSEAMKKEEEIFNANKREADWFNNNTPYVGQTVEYKSYPPLPKWVDKAKQLLNQ